MTGPGANLVEHWPQLSRELDRLLDQPVGARRLWLAGQTLDVQLRRLLEAALLAGERASPLDAVDAVDTDGAEDLPWRRQLGVWRILRPLGAGGSASVFLVERSSDGFCQRAALKLLRAGVLDPVERARFARERALLADLRHPGIARLIDGGVSPEGAPYLVLEWVDGEPITTYCQRQRLALDARLALFQSACDAVAYAHRLLIVHRDLKPANILVDSDGRVKLLDFGIARLLDDDQAATRTEARRLTPAYAAPEQRSGGPLTTAIDVYAMGVLLHELVSGDLPAACVAPNAPPRPRHNFVDSGRIERGLRAIIVNAIEPDPERRYASIAALADDVQRYRDGAPVQARGTSAYYRLARTLRRHSLGVAAGSAFVVLLSIAAWVAQGEAKQARRDAAREATTRAFLVDLLAAAAPDGSAQAPTDVAALVALGAERARGAFTDDPETQAELLGVSGRLLHALGRYADAELTLRQALTVESALPQWQTHGRPETRLALAQLLRDRDQPAQALVLLEGLVAELRGSLPNQLLLAEAMETLGFLRSRGATHVEAIALLEEALSLKRGTEVGNALAIAESERQLGDAWARAGDDAQALPRWRSALAGLPVRTLQQSRVLLSIGYAEQRRGQASAARRALLEALEIQEQRLPPHSSDIAQTQTALGTLEFDLGRYAESLERFQRALSIREALDGVNSVAAAESQVGVAVTRAKLGEFEPAFAEFRSALARFENAPEPPPERIAWALANYAGALRQGGRSEGAVAIAQRAVALQTPGYAPSSDKRLAVELELVHALRGAQRYAAASDAIAAARAATDDTVWQRRFALAEAEVALESGEVILALEQYRAIAASGPQSDPPREHAEAWLGLAKAAERAGKARLAKQSREQAYELYSRFLPPEHPRWAQLRAL